MTSDFNKTMTLAERRARLFAEMMEKIDNPPTLVPEDSSDCYAGQYVKTPLRCRADVVADTLRAVLEQLPNEEMEE